MIQFEVRALNAVNNSIQRAADALSSLGRGIWDLGSFTTSPSMSTAFNQHASFFSGQSGSASRVTEDLRRDISWLREMFDSHIEAFDLQDQLGGSTFRRMGSTIEERDEVANIVMPARDFKPIDNLLYTTPVAAAEATTPLAALMAMFEADDSGPIRLAIEWNRAGNDLINSMAQLQHASTALGASAQGFSFDTARTAIDSVVTTGTTVGNNAVLMGNSMAEFPSVRIANLNALRAIQASTATITEPAARIAAEQSAVATFVSTQLQPSLELLRPPVANLGVPVVGHTGGGALDASTAGQASTATAVHIPAGGTLNASQAATQNLGTQANNAAAQAPSPTGTVAPASAAHTPVSPAGATTTPVNPLTTTGTGAAPAPVANGAENTIAARPAGMNGGGTTATTSPVSRPGTTGQRVTGGVGQTGGQPQGLGTRGSGPVVPQLPGQTHGRGGAALRPGMQNVDFGANNALGNGAPGSGFNGATSRGGMMGTPGMGSHGNAAHGAVAPGNTRGGLFGGMGPGGAAGAGHGRGTNGGRGMAGGLGGHASAKNAKAAAGIFGKGTWAPGVSEYFKRQFLGEKKRTVKEVIR